MLQEPEGRPRPLTEVKIPPKHPIVNSNFEEGEQGPCAKWMGLLLMDFGDRKGASQQGTIIVA